jgi:hypothetical protein
MKEVIVRACSHLRESTRPVFWAGLVGLPLIMATVIAYYYWYHVLVARGFGLLYNASLLYTPFRWARLGLAIALAVGLITFELTRKHLSRPWRYGYVVVIGLGSALFVVGWIIRAFAVPPFWHHP